MMAGKDSMFTFAVLLHRIIRFLFFRFHFNPSAGCIVFYLSVGSQ